MKLHPLSITLVSVMSCTMVPTQSRETCFERRAQALESPEWELQGMSIQGMTLQGTQLPTESWSLEGWALQGQGAVDVGLADGRLVVRRDGVELPESLVAGAALLSPVGSQGRFAVRAKSATTYEVTVDGQGVCADGEPGVFVLGAFDSSGSFRPGGAVTYSCASGVVHKCLRWGYTPWSAGAAAFAACTRLARADYCGDGVSWTRDGTRIDISDFSGVQTAANPEGFSFEAGWAERGAVCVDTPRYQVTGLDGTPYLPPCWAALPRCGSPLEAREAGALLVNASTHAALDVCR